MLLLWKSFLLLAACSSRIEAFTPAISESSCRPKTVLYISSWGTKGPPSRWAETVERENPEERIQAYLKAPEAVEARANIDGCCMVSGLVNSKERTDQTIFDLLNHEESAFEFDKIVAFVNDAKFAKKRLLSRSARYTGLLDKLKFVEAAYEGSFPSVDQLEGVKSWIAYLEGDDMLEQVKQIGAVAKAARSVENVAILLTGANQLDAAKCREALEAVSGDPTLHYTLVAVGKIEEHPEGQMAYEFAEFGTEEGVIPEKAIFSREESLRMITELLQLECGVNKALSFAEVYNQNKTEAKLIKGLREAGYARPQEIDHMLRVGTEAYKKAIEEWKTKNPDAAKGYTSDAWWEREEYQRSRRRSAEREEEKEAAIKTEREKEIEDVAKEWAKREYFRQSMAGSIEKDMTEEDFTKSVWDRAMFEGDLKYRQTKGEIVDEETELADFKTRQQRKQVAMLKRAKEELAEVLDEENLGGDDLKSKLMEGSDDDENKQ